MKSGDILVRQWQEIVAKRDVLKKIAFSVDLARVQTWWWWKEFKDANKTKLKKGRQFVGTASLSTV